jgi:putative acetyltransferase
MTDLLQIETESPRAPEVRELIEALDRYLASLYPPESNHLLDLDVLSAADVRLFVARLKGEAIGCGAVRILADYAEIKRMFVKPSARGLRIGSRLLARLEMHALHEGLRVVRLETGVHQVEALQLYRAAGYRERGPFGAYRIDPLSLFMEKVLTA